MRLIDAEEFGHAMYHEVFVKGASEDVKWDSGCWIRYRLFERVLEEQQPVELRWIPVSDRLPNVGERVLCMCRAGIMEVLRLGERGGWMRNFPREEYMRGFVIAWMPLPGTYKG